MSARLTIEAGEGHPSACDLVPGQPVTLGRHPHNSLVLQDALASRWHALLVHDQGRWLLLNVGAPVNGTLLDGQPLSQATLLEHNQVIEIGDTRLRLELPPPPATSSTVPETPFRADELTALCQFMAAAVAESDATALVRRGLQLLLEHTQAALAGFLSLDLETPVPRLILPEHAQVDHELSRHLTQQVQKDWRVVWLAGGDSRQPESDSLAPLSDALCLPLGTAAAPLGALHLYRTRGSFGDRQRRLAEVLAGHLANCLRLLRTRRTLEAENLRLRGYRPAAEELIGDSPALQSLRDFIQRVAGRPANVLIQGETGVGKELVALAIHRASPRRDGPLVVVNCAAIAAALPEAELFGHCQGAFPGADRDRPGLFQQADEGTLFLDEVGELSMDCQAMLLRVIEGKGFRPVGASRDSQTDVRVLAATNRDLERLAREGKFRPELYYRLRMLEVRVPPLREHKEDIPALVHFYLDRLGQELRRPLAITDAALRRLADHDWPGNVRQLWAVLEGTAVLGDGDTLDADALRMPTQTPFPGLNLGELESWAIREALRQTGGNVTQAAKILGVVRDTLARRMKLRGIHRKEA